MKHGSRKRLRLPFVSQRRPGVCFSVFILSVTLLVSHVSKSSAAGTAAVAFQIPPKVRLGTYTHQRSAHHQYHAPRRKHHYSSSWSRRRTQQNISGNLRSRLEIRSYFYSLRGGESADFGPAGRLRGVTLDESAKSAAAAGGGDEHMPQHGGGGFDKEGGMGRRDGSSKGFVGSSAKGVASKRSWRASDATSAANKSKTNGAKLSNRTMVSSPNGGVSITTASVVSSAAVGDSVAVGTNVDVEYEAAITGSFDFAPPMTVHKFKTMQNRRVPVAIKYTGGGGFKRYFDEIASVLKRHFPDVRIDREIVEGSTREEEVFEVRIDGKLVCVKRRGKPGVHLQMQTIEQAIRKARQRRRPGAVVYGDQETYHNVKALIEERASEGSTLEDSVQDEPETNLLAED